MVLKHRVKINVVDQQGDKRKLLEGGNVVQRLGIEALSESAAEDISTVTGLDAEEVLLVIECLRHYGPVSRLAEKGRAAGMH